MFAFRRPGASPITSRLASPLAAPSASPTVSLRVPGTISPTYSPTATRSAPSGSPSATALAARAPRSLVLTGLAASLLALLLLLAGCSTGGSDSQTQDTHAIEHDLGTTEVPAQPQKVVALEYSFVDALHSLGTDPVGIADDGAPQRIEQMVGQKLDYTSVGTRLEPNLELIAGLKPDLIIADTSRHSAIYDQLQKIAPTIVLNSFNGSYNDIKSAVVTIADALGDKQAGKRVVAEHEQRMSDIKAQIPTRENRRFLLSVAGPKNFTLHSSHAYTGSLLASLGLTPALDSAEPLESGASLERVIAVNPEVLFVAVDNEANVYDSWSKQDSWKQISAVKDNAVYVVERNPYTRFRGLHNAEFIAQDIVDNITGA